MPRPTNTNGTGRNAPVDCECGATVSKRQLADHRRSIKHLTAMARAAAYEDLPTEPASSEPGVGQDSAPASGAPVSARERPKVVALPSRGGGSANKQAAIDEAGDIVDFIQAELITTAAPAAPVLARYWDGQAELNTRNWQILCRNHPQLLAGTLKASDYLAYAGLAKFGTGLLVGLGVETGFLAADNRIAQMAGVTQAWEEVMAERHETEQEVYANYRLAEPEPTPEFPGLVGELFRPAAAAGD